MKRRPFFHNNIYYVGLPNSSSLNLGVKVSGIVWLYLFNTFLCTSELPVHCLSACRHHRVDSTWDHLLFNPPQSRPYPDWVLGQLRSYFSVNRRRCPGMKLLLLDRYILLYHSSKELTKQLCQDGPSDTLPFFKKKKSCVLQQAIEIKTGTTKQGFGDKNAPLDSYKIQKMNFVRGD